MKPDSHWMHIEDMEPRKRHSRRFWIVASLYTVINVGGAILALAMGEMMHAMGHAVFMFIGIAGYQIWSMRREDLQPRELPLQNQTTEILDRLQQSVDALALEVERVGESQRFTTKLLEKQIPEE
jgi:hypothetical protein